MKTCNKCLFGIVNNNTLWHGNEKKIEIILVRV